MASVSYQVVFRKDCDFMKELISVLKGSLDDTYARYEEQLPESIIRIKYIKRHDEDINKYIVGFEVFLDDTMDFDIERVMTGIKERLKDNEYIDVAFKFEDPYLLKLLSEIHVKLYDLEMKLREVISFIFLDVYGGDYYNLLKDVDLIPQFERRANLAKDEEQRRQFLSRSLENEFFHILFSQYCKLTERKPLKQSDLFLIAEISNNFDEFKNNILRRGIRKEKYLDFINSIKADMETLENVRNCVAHSRTPTDDELINYEKSAAEVQKRIDDFLSSNSS